jgi:hypothetical protein
MSTPIALVAIIAVVILVALFRKNYVRASGSFWRASFELEAGDTKRESFLRRDPKA